jgi:hypothetical protein
MLTDSVLNRSRTGKVVMGRLGTNFLVQVSWCGSYGVFLYYFSHGQDDTHNGKLHIKLKHTNEWEKT